MTGYIRFKGMIEQITIHSGSAPFITVMKSIKKKPNCKRCIKSVNLPEYRKQQANISNHLNYVFGKYSKLHIPNCGMSIFKCEYVYADCKYISTVE